MHYTDRSRTLKFQTCPRARYIEYHSKNGTEVDGVRPARLDMNLTLGICFHEGVNVLLDYARDLEEQGQDPQTFNWDPVIQDAVDKAVHGEDKFPGMWAMIKGHGLILEEKEDENYVYQEQAALTEALIRAYGLYTLPNLLFRFRVVEAERDEHMVMGEPGGFQMVWGMRADALLMERNSGDLYVLSLKTAKEYGKRDEDSARHDMQGISESEIVRRRLESWDTHLRSLNLTAPVRASLTIAAMPNGSTIPTWFIERWKTGAAPTIMGIKMEYALKGRRMEGKRGSGQYIYANCLINPWTKGNDLGNPRSEDYAISYEYQDELGMNHRLGKAWRRVNIWEDIGVKAWVEMCHREDIQGMGPSAGLAKVSCLPTEFFRNEEDVERWERQVLAQESRVQDGLDWLEVAENIGPEAFIRALDRYFPMHTRSCDWPTKCQNAETICFGANSGLYLIQPIASGEFAPRAPNHGGETIARELTS